MEYNKIEGEVDSNTLNKQITTVTAFSKYLALLLFITMPFIGAYIGYKFSPEKIIEIENVVVLEIQEKPKNHISIQERRTNETYYITDRISHAKSLLKSNNVDPNLNADVEDVEVKIYLLNKENIIVGALPIIVEDLFNDSSHLPDWRPVDLWHFGGMDDAQYPPESNIYRYLIVHQNMNLGCENVTSERRCIPLRLIDGYTYDGTNTLTRDIGDLGNSEISVVNAYASDFSFEIINHIPID